MAIIATGQSFPGRPNSDATLDRNLRLAQFSGQVLAAFNRRTVYRNMVLHLDSQGAQTQQLPAIGRITGSHHVIGNSLFIDAGASRFHHVKRLVQVDDEYTASTAIPKLEQFETEYAYRDIYAGKLAEDLAITYETRALISAVRAARHQSGNTTNLIPTDMAADGTGVGGFVGSIDVTTGTPAQIGGRVLVALFAAQQNMNEKEIPKEGRMAFLRPAQYSALVQNRELIDRDRLGAGNGLFYNGEVFVGAGFALVETNRMPSANIATNPTGAQNTYTGDFSALVSVAAQVEAIAFADIQAPMGEYWYDPEYRSAFAVASMIEGCAPMRYECAVELSTAVAQPAL